jgi:hypothetical protein
MKAIFGTTLAALVAFGLLGAASPAQQAAPQVEPVPANPTTAPAGDDANASANSKVRIVRLSQVNGAIQMDRNTGHGFEAAMQNMPVVEGARLKTDKGLAEVEFEDSSSLRITPDSVIEFSQLELKPSGATVTTVQVQQGTVYANLANTKGNEFTLAFGSERVSLPPSSHVRLQLAAEKASLSVFDGNAQVAGASGTETLAKNRTLTFNLATQSQPTMAKEVAENDYDTWDHQAVDYRKSYANSSAYGNVSNAYGISDMNYYGSFSDTAGCGSMWRPYFASAAWNPYGSGLWAWYSGAGYSWVSPYPWGWTPYHSGSWNFCQGVGWGWQPGGSWVGLGNAPGSFGALSPLHGRQTPALPVRPGGVPLAGESTLLPVNLDKLTISSVGPHDNFVFRNDSAGLGVPRGSLGKLNKISTSAEHHGSVSRPVFSTPLSSAAGNGRVENGSTSARQGRQGSEISSRTSQGGRGSSDGMGRGGIDSGAMGSGLAGSGSAGRGGSVSGSSHK